MIEPRGIDGGFPHWSSQTSLLISAYGVPPIAREDEEWQAWARTVITFPTLASRGIPRPEGFDHWEDWASQFNQQVRTLGI